MAFLTRKLGPLPVWVWGALLVAVIAVFLVWRRSRGGSSSAAPIQPAGPTQPAIEWTSPAIDPAPAVTTPTAATGLPLGHDRGAPPAATMPVGPTLTRWPVKPLSLPVASSDGLQSNLSAPVQRPWRPRS